MRGLWTGSVASSEHPRSRKGRDEENKTMLKAAQGIAECLGRLTSGPGANLQSCTSSILHKINKPQNPDV